MPRLTQDVEGSATFSEDGRYRFRLDRWWGDGPRIGWDLLNPSKAGADEDDATVRRLIGFTQRWGYDGFTLVNLWPFIATDPADLKAWIYRRELGWLDEQEHAKREMIESVPLVIAAWGAHGGIKAIAQTDWLHAAPVPIQCLGRTRDGHPRHPLRLAYSTPLEPF